ncbi:MAG TPA: TerB family tellurite resistance protein [Candidatus Poseidoniales archaeon]|nr:MAG TPA: TerB family tellurite resistance protein [Candidatus Poseidoniales archaeon]HII58493.1 TerB family tellurite resistance protein [Candidatus Poseidoniaceae archaeon]
MFSDLVNELTIEERLSHAQLMVAVASVDGELVLEELIMIEAIMGKSMLHPEMRVDVRNTLSHPIELEKSMEMLSKRGKQLALRDAVLVSACDGEYDKKEIRVIAKIAKLAGVDKTKLSQLYEWVSEYWECFNKSSTFFD